MLRSTQRKSITTTRYHPYTMVTSRPKKLYFYSDENGEGENEFRTKKSDNNTSMIFEKTESTLTVSTTNSSFVQRSIVSRIKDEQYEDQENFVSHKDFPHVDKFIRNACRSHLREALPTSFKILQDNNGSTRFKMTYDKPWAQCEAVVVRDNSQKLELVGEEALDTDRA